jgi:hypothetical protein
MPLLKNNTDHTWWLSEARSPEGVGLSGLWCVLNLGLSLGAAFGGVHSEMAEAASESRGSGINSGGSSSGGSYSSSKFKGVLSHARRNPEMWREVMGDVGQAGCIMGGGENLTFIRIDPGEHYRTTTRFPNTRVTAQRPLGKVECK